jgi:hypothetical protein
MIRLVSREVLIENDAQSQMYLLKKKLSRCKYSELKKKEPEETR